MTILKNALNVQCRPYVLNLVRGLQHARLRLILLPDGFFFFLLGGCLLSFSDFVTEEHYLQLSFSEVFTSDIPNLELRATNIATNR